MTSEERDLITGLFNRLRTADSNNQTPKDQEAAQLIGQLTGQQPSAPYLLVQTLLVQEHALNNATARIHQLEQQVQQAAQKPAASGAGGFLAGLFGHGSQPAQSQSGVQQGQMPGQGGQSGYASGPQGNPPPYPTTANMAPSAGGGFLKGALGTAAGVAGGALLFQGIQNLLGHNAGPFGGGGFGGFGGGGGGSFLGGGGPEIIERNEVVNNYYDNDRGQNAADDNFQTGEGVLQRDDVGNDAGNSNSSDAGFDNSNPFDKQDNFGLGTDNSALDNNYDAANPDANGGGDLFSGGGDDSGGGDSSGGGDFGGNDDSTA